MPSVITIVAPSSGAIRDANECQAYPTTKSGIATGSTSRTVHRRRAGSAVRSVSHAAPVPMVAASRDTVRHSTRVLRSSITDRSRNRTRWISLQPVLRTSRTISTSGASSAAAISMLATSSNQPRPARRRNRPGHWFAIALTSCCPTQISPACWSRFWASVPVPICPGVIGFGWYLTAGGSAGFGTMPRARGYSKLVLLASTRWPAALVRNARKRCAAAWFFDDLRIAAPEMSSTSRDREARRATAWRGSWPHLSHRADGRSSSD